MQTPDWCRLIEDLVKRGMTTSEIGAAMGSVLTDRMIRAYRLGEEPKHWRGEALIDLWCERMKKKRDKMPTKGDADVTATRA